MMLPTSQGGPDKDASGRPFGAVDLLTLVLEAIRPTLGFDLAVAVICEDNRHVVPVFTTGALSPAVTEGVHVQALAAFVELAGADHATWPSDEPAVIALGHAGERASTSRSRTRTRRSWWAAR
jgi:hypothetical protein